MSFLIEGCRVYTGGQFVSRPLAVSDGRIVSTDMVSNALVFRFDDCVLMPGLVDVHVHLREPGFSYKETIGTGTLAAAHGGFTTVCAMPNLKPVPDSVESLNIQLEMIRRAACVEVHPYGALTVGEKGGQIADLEGMAPNVIAFSDDGRGVQDPSIMREAMTRAAALHKIVAAHCEDNTLLNGGYIHAGRYAEAHNHRGIVSESEWRPIERDLKLADETKCAYHVCHVSTKESVALIRAAKKSGVNVTCETAPHYLTLCEDDLQEHGRFKMNPPLRAAADRDALLEGLCDGTIDMIATDHAPHSAEEKARGLQDSPMGVVGLETAFPVLYTELVRRGVITLKRLIELMAFSPARRFGFERSLDTGAAADFTIFDLRRQYTIDPATFLSMGRATPFEGCAVYGECQMTVHNGQIVWQRDAR